MYAANIQDNMYSQTYHFYEQIIFPTQILLPIAFGVNVLTPFGQGVYNSGLAQFRQECGDQFIGQIQYGATLFVSFQVVFANLQGKNTFDQTVGTSGFAGLFDTSTITQEIITSHNLAGTINLMAYQAGGNPSELAQIFTNTTNGYYITSCSLSNLKQCQQVVNGVLEYGVSNFPTQMNITNGEIEGNAVPIGYTYYPYTILGLNASTSVLTSEIIGARESLITQYTTLQQQNVFISHILGSWITQHMSSNVLSYMQATYANITANIGLLEDQNNGAITCYSQPQNCVANAQKLLTEMDNVDINFIASFNNAYQLQYPYCAFSTTVLDGIAIPIGDGNYIKVQESGFVEELQFTNSVLNEPNCNDGRLGGFSLTMTDAGGNAMYGNSVVNQYNHVYCIGTVIDNPI
jgi:hypothetical protein